MTPHSYGRHVVSFLFSWCSTGGLGPTLLDAGFLYCILSASSLDPKLHRGSRGPPRSGVAFLTTYLQLSGTLLATPLARRTQLNYIIIRCPFDLWNRMFNRHQAEITVMQFRGHSLPVHQSIRVSWDFFFFTSSYFISQFLPTRFPLITAIRMCHFLPVHHLECIFGRVKRSKHNSRSSPSSLSHHCLIARYILTK